MKKLSIDDISVKQMKMFLTVANHRSFSEAADSLFVNQSVVSRTIQGMENALNVVLFKRKSHGIELTNQGKELYRELKSLVGNYEKLVVKVRVQGEIPEDTIVAGVLDFPEIIDLTNNLIRIYSKRNPDVRFSLHHFEMRELRDQIMAGRVHCGFSFKLGIGKLPNVTTDHVAKLVSYFCVNAGNEGIRENSFNPKVLANEELVLTSVVDLISPEERALGVCKKFGFQPRSIRYVSTREEAQIAVKNGEGFSIDGKTFCERYPEDCRGFPISGLNYEQYLVALHKEDCMHQPMVDFLRWIKERHFTENELRK